MRFAPVLLLLASACGGHVELNLFYTDELVEAPTRTIDIAAITGATCDQILSRPHETPATTETVRATHFTNYPVDPGEDVFDGFPTDEKIAIDIAAYDGSLLQVSRACTEVRLTDVSKVDLQLRTLPICIAGATSIDLLLVLDTSLGVDLADPDRAHLSAINDFLLTDGSLAGVAQWGLVTFGHGSRAQELVPATTDRALMQGVVGSLERVHANKTRLFDGMVKGAALLRARAICGRRPVMFVVTSRADDGSEKRFEDAAIAVYASHGDDTDDLYSYGVAMSTSGFDDLDVLIPEEIGVVTGAQTSLVIRQAFLQARDTLNGLLKP